MQSQNFSRELSRIIRVYLHTKKTRVLLHVSKRAFYVSAQTVLFVETVESKIFLICYQSVDIIDKEASHISHHGD